MSDVRLLGRVFNENRIDCVMNFAAFIKVDESIINPSKYYSNNVFNTGVLLE